MYLGELEVKQSDIDDLIKTAECLQIKGLAIPDANETSKNQQKIYSSSVNIYDISEKVSNKHCSSPPRKRHRKDSEDKGSTNTNAEISNSLPSQQSYSFIEQKSPSQNNDDPGTSPDDQIKAETDIKNEEGPSNLEDGELSCQNLVEIGPEDNGKDDSNEIKEDYPSLTEIDIEEEELNNGNDEDRMDFKGAGPSVLQKVSQHFGILNDTAVLSLKYHLEVHLTS